jgi:hypothetical protein
MLEAPQRTHSYSSLAPPLWLPTTHKSTTPHTAAACTLPEQKKLVAVWVLVVLVVVVVLLLLLLAAIPSRTVATVLGVVVGWEGTCSWTLCAFTRWA